MYFATILHANNLKVAALLDSDNAGEQAAKQETLVHTLGNRKILRTGDVCPGAITKPEIEDLLRHTLVAMAQSEPGWDVTAAASSQPQRPIVDIFAAEIGDFSKYRLAKAYLRWTREHKAADLTKEERSSWVELNAGELSEHGMATARGRLNARLGRLIDAPPPLDDAERFAAHLANEFPAVFLFLWDPSLDATNWRAEQAIRPAVVIRKVCGGNRTRHGADTQQVLASVVRTARQRGLDLPPLVAALLRAPEPAVPELLGLPPPTA